MIFSVSGHENLLGTHRNTFEFTKHIHLTRNGDCIIGVDAGYSLTELKKITKSYTKIKIILSFGKLKETIVAELNNEFDDSNEIVVRKTDFLSKRTLGIKADKAAIDIDRNLIEKLKNPEARLKVEIIGIK